MYDYKLRLMIFAIGLFVIGLGASVVYFSDPAADVSHRALGPVMVAGSFFVYWMVNRSSRSS